MRGRTTAFDILVPGIAWTSEDDLDEAGHSLAAAGLVAMLGALSVVVFVLALQALG